MKFEKYEKEGKLLREIAWFGEVTYMYSSSTHTPNETWPPMLIEVKDKIRRYLKEKLELNFECNSLLVNKYATGHQAIGNLLEGNCTIP